MRSINYFYNYLQKLENTYYAKELLVRNTEVRATFLGNIKLRLSPSTPNATLTGSPNPPKSTRPLRACQETTFTIYYLESLLRKHF
jgi:hypothetical protein